MSKKELEDEIAKVRELAQDEQFYGAQDLANLAEAYLNESIVEVTIYCTTRNTGPSHSYDPLHLVYLGTSFRLAEESVGEFSKYERDQMPDWNATILAENMNAQIVKYYMADGWWYSIAKFKLVQE